jgi:uncharacterized membrane protein
MFRTKSAWASKINWTQAIAILAMLLTFFGIDLSSSDQADILAAIVAIQGVITIIIRIFFTSQPIAAKEPS